MRNKHTPTPKTDKSTGWEIGGLEVVPASFARELQRENHALREAGGLMRAWIGNNEKTITERWDQLKT